MPDKTTITKRDKRMFIDILIRQKHLSFTLYCPKLFHAANSQKSHAKITN